MPKVNNGQKVKTLSALKIDGAFGLDANNRLTYTSNGEHTPTLTPEIVEFEQYGKFVWAKDIHGIVYTNDETLYQAALKEGRENLQSQNNQPQIQESQKEVERKQYEANRARAEQMAEIACARLLQRWKTDNLHNQDGIQRKNVPLGDISIFHVDSNNIKREISPRYIELLQNAPLNLLQHINEPWAQDAFQSYLDSRAVPGQDWRNITNQYGITMDELQNGMRLVCVDNRTQEEIVTIPHLKGASINPDTGEFKMNSRSMEFVNKNPNQAQELLQSIQIDTAHQYLAEFQKAMREIQREDPYQAWLDSFARDKDSARRTIFLDPSVSPQFVLTTPNGDRFSVTATHLSILSAPSHLPIEQIKNLNDEFNQQRWQHSLDVRGCTQYDFDELLNAVNMTIEEAHDGLKIEMTAQVCNDNGDLSIQTFEINARDVFVDRYTGEMLIDDKTTSFQGKDESLIDRIREQAQEKVHNAPDPTDIF